jgi:hypothetical protein
VSRARRERRVCVCVRKRDLVESYKNAAEARSRGREGQEVRCRVVGKYAGSIKACGKWDAEGSAASKIPRAGNTSCGCGGGGGGGGGGVLVEGRQRRRLGCAAADASRERRRRASDSTEGASGGRAGAATEAWTKNNGSGQTRVFGEGLEGWWCSRRQPQARRDAQAHTRR